MLHPTRSDRELRNLRLESVRFVPHLVNNGPLYPSLIRIGLHPLDEFTTIVFRAGLVDFSLPFDTGILVFPKAHQLVGGFVLPRFHHSGDDPTSANLLSGAYVLPYANHK